MAIRRLNLSWIMSGDLAKSRKFFTDTLGLKLGEGSSEEYGWLELVGKDGGSYLGVGQCNDSGCSDEHPGQNAVVTFTVDNIEESISELKAKGVKFIDEEIIEVPGHVKMITFVDPDNNKFQLVEEISK